ncbi:Transcriptional activator of fatty acid utilization [Linnemannia elongata]|nr:Transcriptional activator of fatty acid utilization [Linnemannia elongata]
MSRPLITPFPTPLQTCPPIHPNGPTRPHSTTTSPTRTRYQDQIHARTHPRCIKVYDSCLACRKMKKKCNGLPTCKRCQRKGFECSYIDAPQIPRSKAKQYSMEQASHQVQQPVPMSFGQDPQETTLHQSRPTSAFVTERDTTTPDLYHALVSSVAIPHITTYTQGNFSSSLALMGMGCFNITSPTIQALPAMNPHLTDFYEHQSCFEKGPTSMPNQPILLGFPITTNTLIQHLVDVYFECFHGRWMIVDKEEFLAQLYDPSSSPDPLLLVAICAAVAKYSDHEGQCAEPGNLSSIGDQFFNRARLLLKERFDIPSVSTLQALLIMYWCVVQSGCADLQFMYVGMAVRMAQGMELNQPMDPKQLKEMDNREVQTRKTIWWSCYQADRWTSATLNKPMFINDIDCLVDYPSSVNECDDYAVQSFNHMTDLAKILGEVVFNLYTPSTPALCSSAIFSHLDQSLSSWFKSLPFSSESDQDKNSPNPLEQCIAHDPENMNSNNPRIQQDSITSANTVGYYALLFHTVRIMLYRPFLRNSALAPLLPMALQSPQNQCHESAMAISKIAENMVTDQRSHRQLFNLIHVSLCVAANVHRFAISSPKSFDDVSRVTTCMYLTMRY